MVTQWDGVVAPRSGPVKRSVHFWLRCSAILAAAEPRFNYSHKGGAAVNKFVVGGIVLVLVTCGWGTRSIGEQRPAPRGELRIVDQSPWNWQYIVLNVFEHLVECSREGTLVPGLATGWQWLDDRTLEVTLRQGVTFHNGEVFDAEIVKLNWDEQKRLEQPFRSGNYMNFKPGSRLEIIDPYTV